MFLSTKWLLKQLFKWSLFIFSSVLINKPILFYKTYKLARLVFNTIGAILGSSFLFSLSFFEMPDFSSDFLAPFKFIYRNISKLFSNWFREADIKAVEVIQKVTSKENISENVLSKARKKAAEKLSSEDKLTLSRSNYKNIISEVLQDENNFYYKIAAIATTVILFAILAFFFGPDILKFFTGTYSSLFNNSGDGGNNPGGEDENNFFNDDSSGESSDGSTASDTTTRPERSTAKARAPEEDVFPESSKKPVNTQEVEVDASKAKESWLADGKQKS